MMSETMELGLSKRMIDEMVNRVRALSRDIETKPFDEIVDDANAERRRLWQVIEYARSELRQNYGIEYVPSTFEGKSFFYHKDTFRRFMP